MCINSVIMMNFDLINFKFEVEDEGNGNEEEFEVVICIGINYFKEYVEVKGYNL